MQSVVDLRLIGEADGRCDEMQMQILRLTTPEPTPLCGAPGTFGDPVRSE
jgi:hypothetical protein